MNNFKVTEKVKREYDLALPIILQNNEYVVLDLETTGLSPDKGGRIIEIGAVKIKNNKIVDSFSTLIYPEMPIPKSSTAIHGITDSMVKGQPIYQMVLPKFSNFIGELPVIGHNVSFDWDRFLLHYFKTIGIYKTNKAIDTMTLAKVVLPAEKGDKMNLGVVCERCNISLKGAHRAINDALATAKVFLMAKEIITKENMFIQNSFMDFTSNKEEALPIREKVLQRQAIINVSLWEKDFKNKHFKRIYVTTPKSNLFYDVIGGFWQIKESEVEVDFDIVEEDVKEYLKLNNKSLLELFNKAS